MKRIIAFLNDAAELIEAAWEPVVRLAVIGWFLIVMVKFFIHEILTK